MVLRWPTEYIERKPMMESDWNRAVPWCNRIVRTMIVNTLPASSCGR